MYSTPTDNLTFRKGYNFNAKRFCCSPKQRTFKRDAYTATYDLDNKFQTFGNKTIVYDNDGNMTSGPITEGGNNIDLSFNARGQLIGTGDVAYDYDLEGNRTSLMHYDKNKILTQYRYVYNRVGDVHEVLMRVKLTNMTSQSTYYVYGAGLAYEVKITPDGQEAVRYYHYDQVGSTVAMTDSAQAITDRFHYDPWGYVLHSIGDSDTPFQFVGAYGIQTDPNGLINMRARYYNPVTKSFISQDPSGFEGGLNWYLYANGNPFTYIDQNGEFAETVWDIMSFSIGAASFAYNLSAGNYGEAIFDAIGIAYDTIATLIPFLPGGASAALKAGRATKSFSTAYNTGVDFTKIAKHVGNFASKYTADAFSSSAVYGTKLHKYVSESLYSSYNRYSTNFYDFRALSQTKRGGPDFINKNNKIWMDITTPSSWGAHELKYTSGYGFGIGITYTRGVGVNSSRLTTGAGYLSGALSFK